MKPVKNLYYIAILTDPKSAETITGFKHEMQARFGAKHALKSPPHFTLQMPFRALETDEQHIGILLTDFAASQESFMINLNGFGCFPPRVIFVRPENPEPVRQLHQALKPFLRQMPGIHPSNIPDRINPHCTIATRDLSADVFPQAWDAFKNRSYEASFVVSSVALLKHTGKLWKVHRDFHFKGG
ncbi:2'-5' RNA ligase [Cyclonatronum proteinivorum]|uniref:2'-5' RNA ligase n=1 Tax=Cyclonatronum proteinivorum TaxID=1457365 RepID=A0A345UMW9_9BACT|nr:2'-5' RNA ligase family protein [Cyclonatronum proteinivorum]AXJ01821.1 2'-5' RNA ligase [Cyclonatronum proteinivorum]